MGTKAASPSEQRCHPRVALILKIAYPDREAFLADTTSNACPGGLFICTDKRFEIGERFEIELSFPGLLEPLTCPVEVRWRRAAPAGDPDGTAGVGVAFRFVDSAQATWIEALLAAQARHAGPVADPAADGPFRVLVVEDNPLVREMLMFAVRKLHSRHSGGGRALEVTEAENGQAAWEELGQGTFDMAIIDYLMPVMDGVQLIRRIRAAEPHADLPIIVVSAEDDLVRREVVRAGADMFIKKPLVLSLLLASMQRLLGFEGRSGGG